MSIIFKKLYKILVDWEKMLNIKKPTTDIASHIAYKYMQKAKKRDVLKKIVELFSKLEKTDIKVDNCKNTIKIYSKL